MIRFKSKISGAVLLCLIFLMPALSKGATDLQALKDSIPQTAGKQKARILLTISNYYFTVNYDSTLFYAEKALNEYRELDDEKGIISCYGMLADIYEGYGLYDTSITLNFKVIDWAEKHNDLRAYIAYLVLGNTYKDIGQMDKAKTYYLKAIQGNYLPAKTAAFANMGLIFLKKKEYDSASFYFKGALDEYYQSDTTMPTNLSNISTLLLNLSSVAYGKGQYEKGIDLLYQSRDIARRIGSEGQMASIYLNLGDGYHYLKNDKLALKYFLKAKQIADSLGVNKIRADVLQILSEYYSKKMDFEKAYNYFVEYQQVHDSLLKMGYQSSIAEMEVKYLVREKTEKISLLKKQERMVIGLSVSIVIGLLLIGLIIVLLLNRHRLKLRNARNLAEAKTETERIKTKNAEEKLKKMISSLHEKSAFIEELEQEIEKLSKKAEKENIEEKIRILRKTRILTEEDWEDYYRVFNEIYPLFFTNIENYRELSQGDKRQLIFLKLGLSQKEIAFLMGISPEGVKRARQRLAKKIGLKDAGELKDYIERL